MIWLAILLLTTASASAGDFYAASGGVDNSTCGQTTPCAHIAAAVQAALLTNAGGSEVRVHIGAGNWTESVYVTGQIPSAGSSSHDDQLVIIGAGTHQTIWNGDTGNGGTLVANNGANVGVENLTIKGTSNAYQSALFAQMGGLINVFSGVAFGPVTGEHMHAEGTGSQIQLWNSYEILSGTYHANGHLLAISGALIEFNPIPNVLTIDSPSPTYGAFMQAAVGGIIYVGHGWQPSGVPIGQSYAAWANGVIWSDYAGCKVLPGTLPGAVAFGGVCQ